MILAVAATEFEMAPFKAALINADVRTLVCGIGPVESCLKLTRYLERNGQDISMVINFGVAGAFLRQDGRGASLLDICLAETENYGDFGICFPMRIDDFSSEMNEEISFKSDIELLQFAEKQLAENNLNAKVGHFVTVSCVSGTRSRGDILSEKFDGLCENMEGAALARVCREYQLSFLEMRCISNYVEDRDVSGWVLPEACEKIGFTTAQFVRGLGESDEKY